MLSTASYIQTNKVRVTCKVRGSTLLNITSYKSTQFGIASLSMNKLYENKILTVLHPAEAGSPAYRRLRETKTETSFSPRRPNTTYHIYRSGLHLLVIRSTSLKTSLLALALAEQLSPRKQLRMNDGAYWTDKLAAHLWKTVKGPVKPDCWCLHTTGWQYFIPI